MNIKVLTLGLSIMLFWVYGCKPKVVHSELFKKIIISEQGVFRGVDFDMPIEDVKKIEKVKPELDDVLGLKYQIKLNETDYLYLEYDKQESKVKSFRAKISVTQTSSGANLYKELKAYYTDKYGVPKGRDKEEFWEITRSKGVYYIDLTWIEKENNIYIDLRK